MGSSLSFSFQLYITNPDALPELQGRLNDLSPAFEEIFKEWVSINQQKFKQAKGGEMSGANVFDEIWEALTPDYIKQKHPSGAPARKTSRGGATEYPDWLMVRTGALMNAMTTPDALFQMFSETEAVFGSPKDPDLVDKILWNEKKRQVVFLSIPDMNAIKRNLQDYLNMGGNYQQMRFAKGMESLNTRGEIARMDADFSNDIHAEGF